jgi:glycosyltransferase involved in cell wall biosynthesis
MLKVSRLFRQVHRRHRVDLIHQLNPVNPGLSAGLSCSHVPLVLGWFVSSWPIPLPGAQKRGTRVLAMARAITAARLLALDRLQQRRARALLLSTPAAMSRIHEQALVAGRVHLLPYGVDTRHFTPVSASASATPEILFIGSLTERKGALTLLHAFDAVIRRLPRCRLRIAGVGPEEAAIRALVAASPWHASVELLGGVTRPFIPQLLGRCSVLCVPSRGEPFGLVALEAMASGKPVVGTDAGGLAHLISARGGRKVPPGDAAALANALLEVLESPALAAEMGAFNRALVESSYSWDSVIERLEAIYHQSLDPPRRKAP